MYHRGIASFGALITLLALTFDPFMQQVVVYPLRSVPMANATISRAQNYTDLPASGQMGVPGLSSAFYAGCFLSKDQVPDFTPTCPTGNCTWPLVTSLAVCSSCENVSKQSALNCTSRSNGGEYSDAGTILSCAYNYSSLPSTFSFSYAEYNSESGGGEPVLQVNSIIASDSYSQSNFTFAGIQNPWTGFARVAFDEGVPMEITNVTICALYPCVKTYNVSVSEGAFSSQEVRTWDVKSTFQLMSPDIDIVTYQVLSLPEDFPNDSTTESDFFIESYTVSLINTTLSREFSGSLIYGESSGNPAILSVLNSTDDLGGLMDTIAISLSNRMRNVSSLAVTGQAFSMQNYVHVRWIWLILPVALAPASMLFLTIVMWRSRTENIKIWKSSGLASMFHGLEDHTPRATERLDQQTEMEDVSRRMFVSLRRTDNHVERLVQRASLAAPSIEAKSSFTSTASEQIQHVEMLVSPQAAHPLIMDAEPHQRRRQAAEGT